MADRLSKCPFQQSRSQAVVVSKARHNTALPPAKQSANATKTKRTKLRSRSQTIRTDVKLPQLTRSKHRDSLEQHVALVLRLALFQRTILEIDLQFSKAPSRSRLPPNPSRLRNLTASTSSMEATPDTLVLSGERRTLKPEHPSAGSGLNGSAVEESVDYHFTDVAPECRGE
jgi:hypothetical protein